MVSSFDCENLSLLAINDKESPALGLYYARTSGIVKKMFFSLDSNIRMKDLLWCHKRIRRRYIDESRRRESDILGANRGPGHLQFFGHFADTDTHQHDHFMVKKDLKVGLHKKKISLFRLSILRLYKAHQPFQPPTLHKCSVLRRLGYGIQRQAEHQNIERHWSRGLRIVDNFFPFTPFVSGHL